MGDINLRAGRWLFGHKVKELITSVRNSCGRGVF
jgi:hypothetical protein